MIRLGFSCLGRPGGLASGISEPSGSTDFLLEPEKKKKKRKDRKGSLCVAAAAGSSPDSHEQPRVGRVIVRPFVQGAIRPRLLMFGGMVPYVYSLGSSWDGWVFELGVGVGVGVGFVHNPHIQVMQVEGVRLVFSCLGRPGGLASGISEPSGSTDFLLEPEKKKKKRKDRKGSLCVAAAAGSSPDSHEQPRVGRVIVRPFVQGAIRPRLLMFGGMVPYVYSLGSSWDGWVFELGVGVGFVHNPHIQVMQVEGVRLVTCPFLWHGSSLAL